MQEYKPKGTEYLSLECNTGAIMITINNLLSVNVLFSARRSGCRLPNCLLRAVRSELNVADLIGCFLSLYRSVVVGSGGRWRRRLDFEELFHLRQVDGDVITPADRPDVLLFIDARRRQFGPG